MSRSPVLAGAALALLCSTGLHAEPVSIRHGELTFLGNLEMAAPASAGAVLLVHGTLAHHRMELIATQQSLLAERGVSSLAVTLSLDVSSRLGMYDCSTPHAHRHQDAVAEIGAWRDWLQARGVGKVVLVGHSRGGNQAARFALASAARLQGLVLIAPSTFDGARVAAAYDARSGTPLEEVIAKARSLPGDTWLDEVRFLYCGPSRVTAASFLSYYLDDGARDTPTLLPRLVVPTLVIAGSADNTVPGVPARTTPHVDDDTRLLVVDGADHFFRDLYAEDVADAIAEFFAGHAP